MLEIANPIFFISENPTYERYFSMVKEKSSRFYDFNKPTDAYDAFGKQSSTDMNDTIFIISDETKALPIRDFIELIRRYIGKTQVIVFSQNKDVEYIKSIMKEGVDGYLALPSEIVFERLSSYQKWFEKVFAEINKLSESIKKTNTLQKLDTLKRDNWPNDLLTEINGLIKDKNPDAKYIDNMQDLLKYLEKETGKKAPKRQKGKVLTVDDEEEIRSAIYLTLKKEYQILEAQDGKSTLTAIKKDPDIDVVLLDIMLPDIQGTELVSKIKKISPEIEIIMLTAYKESELVSDSLGDGAFDFLNKPFEKGVVKEKINSLLDKRYYSKVLTDLALKL